MEWLQSFQAGNRPKAESLKSQRAKCWHPRGRKSKRPKVQKAVNARKRATLNDIGQTKPVTSTCLSTPRHDRYQVYPGAVLFVPAHTLGVCGAERARHDTCVTVWVYAHITWQLWPVMILLINAGSVIHCTSSIVSRFKWRHYRDVRVAADKTKEQASDCHHFVSVRWLRLHFQNQKLDHTPSLVQTRPHASSNQILIDHGVSGLSRAWQVNLWSVYC